MALMALRDTYVLEELGGAEVRRRVMAGAVLPAGSRAETDADFEDRTPETRQYRFGLPVHSTVFDTKKATLDEMRAEVLRRRAEGQEVALDGDPSKARRAALLQALGG
jgi:hypothetical protein